jgi:hypothetical protein
MLNGNLEDCVFLMGSVGEFLRERGQFTDIDLRGAPLLRRAQWYLGLEPPPRRAGDLQVEEITRRFPRLDRLDAEFFADLLYPPNPPFRQEIAAFLDRVDADQPPGPIRPSIAVVMLEVATVARHERLVREVLDKVQPLAEQIWSVVAPPNLVSPARLSAEAFALLGLPKDARRLYEGAVEACSRASYRPELALTCLGLAGLLLEHYPGERDAAIGHLDFAISELREMKMQPALERALRHRGLLKA